jgi:serine protease Do
MTRRVSATRFPARRGAPARPALRRGARALGVILLACVVAAPAVQARPWSWLGVRIRDLSEQETEEIATRHGIREGFGVLIVEVIDGAPAEKAGLRTGDIIVAFGDRPVTETRLLQRLIAATPVGGQSRLTVLRAEGRHQVAVTLAVMPRSIVGERMAAEFGFIVREPEGPGSTIPAIATVVRGSPAEKAGLEAGDVILQVNDRAVISREAARDALADAVPEQPLHLTVRRGGAHLSVTLSMP